MAQFQTCTEHTFIVSTTDRVCIIDFNSIYQGDAPWDISRPQKEFVRLEEAGEIVGSVLDVGCGTGENALFLSARGHEVWGIDFTSNAIKKARDKATERNLNVTFLTRNVLDLHALGRVLDTVIDSGLFHVFSDEERPLFVTSLASVLRRHGTYFMLCLSELEPGSYGPRYGPRRVTQAEIRNAFSSSWHINYIRQARIESRRLTEGTQAWLSSISKE
ncbi:MAG: class I SAM-dependent methyltransferase [Halobacteriota archaeon]|jgi:2-polyprenyl-3-methyl-5-hydroxy-6-metoxy-1,4-benzoquinol methylase